MANTLDEKAIAEAVLPDVIKSCRRASRDDVIQNVWVAYLLTKPLGGDIAETTRRIAKKLLQSKRDRLTEILRRVKFDENALAFPCYDDKSVDVSAVVQSTLRKLDKRDNYIFRRRFLRGEKQKTIASDLGLSTSSISRRCQHIAAIFVKEYNKAKKND